MEQNSTIKTLPFARFQAMLFALLGLLLGFCYSFGGLMIDILVSLGVLSPESMSTPGLSLGTLAAFGALILMPIVLATAGFVVGIAVATLCNLFK